MGQYRFIRDVLTYLAGKDREIRSRDDARFSCLLTGV